MSKLAGVRRASACALATVAAVTVPGAAGVGTSYFVGSGSSQAAAVTGDRGPVGAVPDADPNQMKRLLRWRTSKLGGQPDQGIGALDMCFAWQDYKDDPGYYSVSASVQNVTRSTGTGSLEASRGSAHVSDGASQLTGEKDIFGAFSTTNWAAASASQTAWKGGSWMGHDWTGTRYTISKSGLSSWTGRAWSGRAWSDSGWASSTWQNAGWS